MLSIMNEIDLYLLLPLCVLHEIQNQIFQQLVSEPGFDPDFPTKLTIKKNGDNLFCHQNVK